MLVLLIMIVVQVILLALLGYLSLYFLSMMVSDLFGVPFVPTSNRVLDNIFKYVKLNKNDLFFDLGSGDGRLMIAFAKKGCSVEGVEINPILVLISKIWIRKAGLKDKAKVRLGNMWSADLSSYDIILIFGMNHFMLDLEKKVLKEARNSAKIITHSCKFPFLVPTKRLKNVNLYVINDRELKH